MILYRYLMIHDIILNQVISINTHVSDVYGQYVVIPHKKTIDKINKLGYVNLLRDKDFIEFVNDSIKSLINIKAYVSIYDIHGNKIITNKPMKIINFYNKKNTNFLSSLVHEMDKYFLKHFMSPGLIKFAFEGITHHTIYPNALVLEEEKVKNLDLLTSYIPIIGDSDNNFSILCIIEVDTDLTSLWDDISTIEVRIFFIICIMSFIFCVIIIATSNNAENIIKKQFEAKTILEETMKKVEQASSVQSKFLANTSHELRTPLNSIIGFSDILLANEKNISPINYEYLQDINNAGKHLLGIINDILDISKISADKLTVDYIELDLNKIITSSLRLVKPRADQAQVELKENLSLNHVIIKADQKRLKQVLLNLLSNAIKFTNIGGSVTTSMEIDEKQAIVYISIVDTGIGIEEQDIPKILEPFGQIDSTLSRKYDGTGLGLPLTKKLVKLMQGTFDLQSKIGVGTKTTLSFKYSSIVI